MAKRISQVKEKLQTEQQTASAPASGGTGTGEHMAHLHKGLQQALTPDAGEAALRVQALMAQNRAATARDAEAAIFGATIGEAFLVDATGADVLAKVTRHETALMNNLRKAQRMLMELQAGRVEPAPGS